MEKYVEAGEAVQKARRHVRETVEAGKTYLEIAEETEELIRDEGLEPAFPVNVSVNEVAAHYTPSGSDESTVRPEDVVKVDVGAHCDGYIADSAVTVNPSGEHQELIDATEEVLEKALEYVEPGVTVGELGTFIHNQVPDRFSPVRNLTGHSLDRYTQHAGLSIPNIRNSDRTKLEKGDAVAIEPFLSTGEGRVVNGKKGNIYIDQGGRSRSRSARKLSKKISRFEGLPWTTRWLKLNGREKMALKKMVENGSVKHYPVLREKNGLVAQAEHTVIVGEKVTTRR